MKKTIRTIAACAVALSTLAACSSSSSESTDSKATAEASSTGDSTTAPFTSTATCKKGNAVKDVVLEGKDGKYTATYTFVDEKTAIETYPELLPQIVMVGKGATTSSVLEGAIVGGQVDVGDVKGEEIKLEGGKLIVSVPFESAQAVTRPFTWFAELTAGKEKIAQCGVFGESVTVK